MLRRHDARAAQLVLTGAARRRVFGEYQRVEPSRFLDEVPAELWLDGSAPCPFPAARTYGGVPYGRDFAPP